MTAAARRQAEFARAYETVMAHLWLERRGVETAAGRDRARAALNGELERIAQASAAVSAEVSEPAIQVAAPVSGPTNPCARLRDAALVAVAGGLAYRLLDVLLGAL